MSGVPRRSGPSSNESSSSRGWVGGRAASACGASSTVGSGSQQAPPELSNAATDPLRPAPSAPLEASEASPPPPSVGTVIATNAAAMG